MILKAPDEKSAEISALEKIFLTADREKQAAIARELRILRNDTNSESEAAYLINFHLRHNQNTIVIHDLRLELDDGRVAHIDHLLIHSSHRFYILESRYFSDGLQINAKGEFLRWNDWRQAFEPTPSPIEQNKRHAEALRQTLTSLGLCEPHIESFVLIGPHARIDRSKRFDTELVVRADLFLIELTEELENFSFSKWSTDSAKKTISTSISDIAIKLIALHRPIVTNYANKIWLSEISPLEKIAERLI
ncbi:MAG: nuclease-related domain-containing protein [Burkholderiaceae bacterium]